MEIGPVPAPAVRAWLNYAREVLDALRRASDGLSPRLLDQFEGYVEQWSEQVRGTDVFRWEGEVDSDHLEYLVNGLYRVGERVEEEADEGRMRLRPPEADKFHALLVAGLLDALAAEGPAHAQFVEQLRERWRAARLSV